MWTKKNIRKRLEVKVLDTGPEHRLFYGETTFEFQFLYDAHPK